MNQVAFTMKLKPGCKEEYKRRHAAIWPEVKALIQAEGITDYSIFLDEETNTLFAVHKNAGSTFSKDLADNELLARWWQHMADIMETNADYSPVMKSMECVFHMD